MLSNIINTILCKIGIHKYRRIGDDFDEQWNGGYYYHYICRRSLHCSNVKIVNKNEWKTTKWYRICTVFIKSN